MTADRWLWLGISVIAGLSIGAIYFFFMWQTVKNLTEHERPKFHMIITGFLRVLLVSGAFVLVANGDWLRMVGCLLGFMIARYVGVDKIKRKIKHLPPKAKAEDKKEEAGNPA